MAAFFLALGSFSAQAQHIITTVAGGGPVVPTPATAVSLERPGGVAVDSSGNIYIASCGSHVFKMDSAGQLTVLAGTGFPGYAGDGGLATAAELNCPSSIALDSAGNVFIADTYNSVIRQVVAATGKIQTVAGNGTQGHSGDGGPATQAEINQVSDMAVDPAGNIFISEWSAYRIREVVAATGIIKTVAGTGIAATNPTNGEGGPATSAQINTPHGLAVDASGNLFYTDSGLNVVREVVKSTGNIQTVAGNGIAGFSGDNGPATAAELLGPMAIALDSAGDIFISDNLRIREVVKATGKIMTVAGTGTYGFSGDGGPATSAEISTAWGLAVDPSDNLYITDSGSGRIREVASASQIIQTIAGNGFLAYSGDGGPATNAQLDYPEDVFVDAHGNTYIADTGSNVVREVEAATGNIKTVAGNGTQGYSGDGGVATTAQLHFPSGVAVDASGNVYIADSFNYVVREVDATTGKIRTIAGNGTPGYSGDGGLATSAQMNYPICLRLDSSGNLYIGELINSVVRKVNLSTGTIQTVAGKGGMASTGDGGPATSAYIGGLVRLAVDRVANLYISDENIEVRKVTASSGIIDRFAGNGTRGYSGDGGPATSAAINSPSGVAVDGMGTVFFTDFQGTVVREVTPDGLIHTVAGIGTPGFSGDGGDALNAEMLAAGLAGGLAGDLMIADVESSRIRKITGLVSTSYLALALSPRSVSFGSLKIGVTSASHLVTLTNSGTANAGISSLSFSGTNADDFVVATGGPCTSTPFTLAPAAQCTVAITFTPAAGGRAAASLVIADNALDSPQTVTLSGAGDQPVVTLSARGLTFSAQVVGTTSTAQTETITNTGTADLSISTVAISGTNAGDFSKSADTCTGATVAPTHTCAVSITFAPSAAGGRSASLNFTDNAGGNPQVVNLSGTGTAPALHLAVSTLSFGNQLLSTTSAAKVETVTNIGNANLIISTATIGGTNASDFTRGTNTCTGATVAPSQTCSVSVTFRPSAAGNRSASLSFADNAAGTPQAVSLMGTGINPVPAITALSPSSVTALAAAQTLTINGTNFLSTSTATYNGVSHAVTFVSATQLKITMSTTDQATAGAFAVVVSNPSPGGGGSTSVKFTVNNRVPAMTTLSPASATTGAAAQTLTINGANFLSRSTVTYKGVAHAATYVSATQLKITLSTTDQTAAGTNAVVVTNPSPGGGASNTLNFTVNNPKPAITTLSPASAMAGAASQTLTISGTNFASTSTVTYHGVVHAVTHISATQLRITLSTADQATAGTHPVVVTNPSPGGGASNTLNFTVNNPKPAITTMSPASAMAGGASQTLTINGTNFVSTSTVTYHGVVHAVTHVSATQVKITLSTVEQAAPGIYPVVVTNPSPGGGTSNSYNFTVSGTAISYVGPLAVALDQGGSAQAVAVTLSRTSYTGSVMLATSTLPTGVTATYTQPGTGSSGVIKLTPSSTATLVTNRTITITASGTGVASATNTFTLTVTPPIAVTLTPATANVPLNGTQVLTATITNATGLKWYVNGVTNGSSTQGTLTGCTTTAPLRCTYKAPASNVPSPNPAVIEVASLTDPTRYAKSQLTVTDTIAVTLSPASASIPFSGTQLFTAAVSGSTNTALNWYVNGTLNGNSSQGMLTGTGLTRTYKAPASVPPNPNPAVIKAASVADPAKFHIASVTVSGASGLVSSVLYSFSGPPDGGGPVAGLIMDASGNLYGTTQVDGNARYGTVFELVKSSTGYTEKVLHSFTGGEVDGANPYAGLIMDASGNLYSTTYQGGTANSGTVFELVRSSTGYTEKVLHSFTGAGGDGTYPVAGLIMDASGNLYGTTYYGGTANDGTGFELVKSSTGYTEKVLYSFTAAGGDGAGPCAGLIMDASGNLYGTTYYGGTANRGTVFELVKSSTGYTEKVLYTFTGAGGDGFYPYGDLSMDAFGNLYDATQEGGTAGMGTVFELVKSSTGYTEKVLYSFTGAGGDGASPYAGLIMDASGNLYSTTDKGGSAGGGTVFELVKSSTGYTEKVLHSFTGAGGDGLYPYAGLIRDTSGNLYSTTKGGGTASYGTVFEIRPAP